MKSAKPEQCQVMWSRGPLVTLNPFSSKASTNRSFPVVVALTVPKAANVPLNVPSFICADAGADCAKINAIATPNRNTLWGPRTLVFIFALRDIPDYCYEVSTATAQPRMPSVPYGVFTW